MRIVVTGGSGQVGRAAAQVLNGLGTVTVLDRRQLDLAKPSQVRTVLRGLRPEVIVNAAAYTAVDAAEDDLEAAMTVNAESVAEMAGYAREAGTLIVHFSTDYVFDGLKREPYREDDAPNPLSVYGRSKLAGERALRAAHCRHVIVRTSWVYAEQGRNFVRTMLKLAAERDEVKVVNDQFGAPTYAGFLAQATRSMIDGVTRDASLAARVADGEIVHLANAGETTWFGFARAIFEHLAVAGKRRPALVAIPTSAYPTRAARPRNSRFDMSRAEQVWRLSPPEWRVSLAECLHRIDTLTG